MGRSFSADRRQVSHRTVFLVGTEPTPMDVVRVALERKTMAPSLEHARRAMRKVSDCIAQIVTTIELDAEDEQKIAEIEAALIRLFL